MSAIEAASVKVATMADGTLRITCDIEPAHAQAAFALFGSPGTPMALVALKTGHAALSDEVEAKPKGGQLAKLAGIWCNEPVFQKFIRPIYDRDLGGDGSGWGDVTPDNDFGGDRSKYTAHCVKVLCEIDSRALLDHDEAAQERFQRLIRGPYMKHCMTTRETA